MSVLPMVCRCYLRNGGFQTLLISGLFPTSNVYISSFMGHRNIIPLYLYLPSLSTQHIAEVSELPSLSDWSVQMAPSRVVDGNPSPSHPLRMTQYRPCDPSAEIISDNARRFFISYIKSSNPFADNLLLMNCSYVLCGVNVWPSIQNGTKWKTHSKQKRGEGGSFPLLLAVITLTKAHHSATLLALFGCRSFETSVSFLPLTASPS